MTQFKRSGFDFFAPAVVYVLHHPEWSSCKVGITGTRTRRIDQFRVSGWCLVGRRRFEVGQEAWDVEQDVLWHIREELRLPPHLPRELFGQGGWTETVCAEALPARELWRMVRESAA